MPPRTAHRHVIQRRLAFSLSLLIAATTALTDLRAAEADAGPNAPAQAPAPAAAAADTQLVDFGAAFDPDKRLAINTDARVAHDPARGVLGITYLPGGPWPGITVSPAPPAKSWDIHTHDAILVTVRNVGEAPCEFGVRVDSPKPPEDTSKPDRLSVGGMASLQPGETQTVRVTLDRRQPGVPPLFGMDRFPQGMVGDENRVDPAEIVRIAMFVLRPSHEIRVEVQEIKAVGQYLPQPWERMDAAAFFPFIDPYGQFVHQTWPGKVTTDAEMAAEVVAERADLAANPGPADWNGYGGWTAGPQLDATGHFRAAKHVGKWWLVDPDGRLFFSVGISGIADGLGSATIIDERESYFAWLPPKDGDYAKCYDVQKQVSRGHYKGKQPATFDFRQANLMRRYGADWKDTSLDLIHTRFRSWGMNSFGCWTRPPLYQAKRTPYAEWIFYRYRGIQGKMRGWKRFPDVFDPSFPTNMRDGARRLASIADDPWCIGIFSDNELPWNDPSILADCVLSAPPTQPAKLEFVKDLQATYPDIAALNTAWRTTLASWDALLANRDLLNQAGPAAEADAAAFYDKVATRYFETAQSVVREVAPKLMYLGCRFNGDFPDATRVAANYVDVLSYNLYRDSVANFTLPDGVDLPVVIGEFHFGALDRGLFGDGLRSAANQADRAAKYTAYVGGALRNPVIVGTHWFTYSDEPTAGRALDAENHQIGFVDVTDTPNAELVAASRTLGATLYSTRLGSTEGAAQGTPAKPEAPANPAN